MRALPFGIMALLAACGGASEPNGASDGLWRVTAVDGAPVGTAEFLVRIRGGRVIGGKDGCNAWVYDRSRPPAPDGTRMVISDLTECSALPQRPAYWRALGNGNAVPELTGQGQLRLRAGGSDLLASPAPVRR